MAFLDKWGDNMKLKEFDILLDLKKSRKIEEFEVVQGDCDTNVFNIKITNEGKEYLIGDNTIEIAFKRPASAALIQNNVTVTDNKIRCILDTDIIAVPGKVLGEVRIKNDNILLTSSQFEFYVRQSIR